MRVTHEHHTEAEAQFKAGSSTPEVQSSLINKFGLTHTQANAACRTARKHLGIWKGQSKSKKNAARRRIQSEADVQSEIKTQVDLDDQL